MYTNKLKEYLKDRYNGRKLAGLCVVCGNKNDSKLSLCNKCREVNKKRHKAKYKKTRIENPIYTLWKDKNRQECLKGGICPGCKRRDCSTGLKLCQVCIGHNKKYRTNVKIDALKAYGGAICACCGEVILEFLTIDHIDGGGTAHRVELKMGGGYSFYTWLKRNNYPSGFQVLCMNCNLGRQINDGICPHKSQNLG